MEINKGLQDDGGDIDIKTMWTQCGDVNPSLSPLPSMGIASDPLRGCVGQLRWGPARCCHCLLPHSKSFVQNSWGLLNWRGHEYLPLGG